MRTDNLTLKFTGINIFFTTVAASFGGFSTVFLLSRGFDEGMIGLATAIGMVGAAVLQLLISSLIDSSKRLTLREYNLIIVIPAILLMISLLFQDRLLWLTMIQFIVCYSLVMMMGSIINSTAFFILNNGYPLKLGISKSLGSISYGLSSFLIGLAITQFGPDAMVIIAIIAYMIYLLILLRIPFKYIRENPQNKLVQTNKETSSNRWNKLFIMHKSYLFFLAGVVCFLIFHNIVNTFLIQVLESVGGGEEHLGIALLIGSFSEIPTTITYDYYSKYLSTQKILLLSGLFFIIKAIVTYFAPNVFWIYIAQLLQMMAYGLFAIAGIFYTNAVMGEEDMFKGQALFGVSATLGGVIGNAVGGFLISNINLSFTLLFCIIISIIGLVLFYLSFKNNNLKAN